jgi:hypothetical protein
MHGRLQPVKQEARGFCKCRSWRWSFRSAEAFLECPVWLTNSWAAGGTQIVSVRAVIQVAVPDEVRPPVNEHAA